MGILETISTVVRKVVPVFTGKRQHTLRYHFANRFYNRGTTSPKARSVKWLLLNPPTHQSGAQDQRSGYNSAVVAKLGPDLAATRWLIKCGATAVTFTDGTVVTGARDLKRLMRKVGQDPTLRDSLKLAAVDATDSAITHRGFDYFKDCDSLWKVSLNFCDFVTDEALHKLTKVRNLNDLELVCLPHITEDLVYSLAKLKTLQRLHLYFLPWVGDQKVVLRRLKVALPQCHVTYPPQKHFGFGRT